MTKKAPNLYLQVLKHFYGVRGELDEYRLSEMSKFGNHRYLLLYALVVISFLVSFLGIADPSDWLLLILLFLPPYLQKRMAKRLGLDRLEVEAS